MVDVEQRTLRAFEQDALALAALAVEQRPHRVHIGKHLRRKVGKVVIHRARIDLGHAEAAAQGVVMHQQALDLGAERRQVGKVHEADGAAADLVLVGRADAALGGADAALGIVGLADRLELAMQRQDQGGVLGDAQTLGSHRDALLGDGGDLVEQGPGVDNDAVADDRQLALAHRAGRQQRQLVDGVADDQRVAGIMPALEADDDVGLLGEPVDDLAFTLVSPLGADHHDVGHETIPAPRPDTSSRVPPAGSALG